MPRYKLITSTTPSGGFSEFSAADDAAALVAAGVFLHGARIVALDEVTWRDGVEHSRAVPR